MSNKKFYDTDWFVLTLTFIGLLAMVFANIIFHAYGD